MKRVIIFCNRTEDAAGLNQILAWDRGLDVVGWETELDAAIQRSRLIQPEMIIIASEGSASSPSPEVLRLLQETANATIIEINLQACSVYVYRGEQAMLRQIEDLLEHLA